VFKGSKNLSPETAAKISRKLKMDPVEGEHFYTLVQMENAKDPELKKQFERKLKTLKGSRSVSKLKPDDTRLIPEWYHTSIIAMADVAGDYTPKTVAMRLGITQKVAQDSMEKLEAMGILKRVDGRWEAANDHLIDTTIPGKPEDIIRSHQKILSMAADALVSQPREERMSLVTQVAFHKSRLPEAREAAHEYMRKMQVLVDEVKEDGLNPDDVYVFLLNFFNVTDK
jgi:uncharacterized protein (TIGR02147 family)